MKITIKKYEECLRNERLSFVEKWGGGARREP